MPMTLKGPVNPPPGCRFYGRCRYRKDECQKQAPDLKDMGDNHYVACHFAGKL